MSQTIRALEVEIGAPLFTRTSRRVRLTRLGERFRVQAEQGFTQLRRALRDAQKAARGVAGELRVGHFAAIGASYVAQVAAVFEARYPTWRVVTMPVSRDVAFRALRTRQVDLLLALCPGIESVRNEGRIAGPAVAADPRAVLVNTAHPLANFEQVSIEDVADHELLSLSADAPRAFLEGWTPASTPSGKPLRRTEQDLATALGREPVYLEDVLNAVARSGLAHLTCRSVIDHHPYPGLVVVPVHDLPPLVMAPVWQADRGTAAIHAFVKILADTYRRPIIQ